MFHTAREGISSITLSLNLADVCEWEVLGDSPELKSKISSWMEAYLAGTDPKEQLPFVLDKLSPFTKHTLATLQHIPFGDVVTYQSLAERAGRPKAARAVGSACGRNPFPLVIPCHRVIASGGRLGGFSLDITIKKHLLTFERECSIIHH